MIKMKLRSFIALLASIVLGTNSFSLGWQKILDTEEQQSYNKERADRIAKRVLSEAKQYHDVKAFEKEIEDLSEQLKNCK